MGVTTACQSILTLLGYNFTKQNKHPFITSTLLLQSTQPSIHQSVCLSVRCAVRLSVLLSGAIVLSSVWLHRKPIPHVFVRIGEILGRAKISCAHKSGRINSDNNQSNFPALLPFLSSPLLPLLPHPSYILPSHC